MIFKRVLREPVADEITGKHIEIGIIKTYIEAMQNGINLMLWFLILVSFCDDNFSNCPLSLIRLWL